MNFLSIVFSVVFALMSLAFAIMLLLAISRNQKTAGRYRQAISQRLSRLRLSRMLSHHKIDREAYLQTQPILDIEEQMKNCSNCQQTRRCDDVLIEAGEDDTRFCVNDEKLQDLKNKFGSAA